MPDVVVYGAGGMGREVAETLLMAAADGQPWNLLGFLDDRPGAAGEQLLGYPILGPGAWISDRPGVSVLLGIGHPLTRFRVVERMLDLGARFATLLHPTVTRMPSAAVGEGVVVFGGCTLSSGAALGDFTYLNYHSVVSHDATVEPYACVMAQVALSGNVRVGQGAFVGVGVSTRQGVTIGEWGIVGAGAGVIRDLPPLSVSVGVPACPVRQYASYQDMPAF
jgi:sugar O-acyltransferase (sialic acid O-acetyltransferase NeuD family)